MIVKLLTEHHLEFLSLKGGCTGSSESTHVKMPHCWKSHVTAHFEITNFARKRQDLAIYMLSFCNVHQVVNCLSPSVVC